MTTPFKSPSKTGTELETSSLLAEFMMSDTIKQGMGRGKEFMDWLSYVEHYKLQHQPSKQDMPTCVNSTQRLHR